MSGSLFFSLNWDENYESATWLISNDGKHATVLYKIVITSLCFYKNKILAIQNTC